MRHEREAHHVVLRELIYEIKPGTLVSALPTENSFVLRVAFYRCEDEVGGVQNTVVDCYEGEAVGRLVGAEEAQRVHTVARRVVLLQLGALDHTAVGGEREPHVLVLEREPLLFGFNLGLYLLGFTGCCAGYQLE